MAKKIINKRTLALALCLCVLMSAMSVSAIAAPFQNTNTLICTLSEHSHDADCYGGDHTDDCYEAHTHSSRSCDRESHKHTDDCHEHNDDCYTGTGFRKRLTCGIDECDTRYDYTCTIEKDLKSDCKANHSLTCTETVHVHTGSCYSSGDLSGNYEWYEVYVQGSLVASDRGSNGANMWLGRTYEADYAVDGTTLNWWINPDNGGSYSGSVDLTDYISIPDGYKVEDVEIETGSITGVNSESDQYDNAVITITVKSMLAPDGSVVEVTYSVTFNFVDEAGNSIMDSVVLDGYKENAPYSLAAPSIDGYEFVKFDPNGDPDSGIIDGNKVVTAIYKKAEVGPAILIVNYVDEAGNELCERDYTEFVAGSNYAVSTPIFEGYTFKESTGDEMIGVMDSDKEVTLVYSKDIVNYTLTVKHVDEAGNELAAPTTESVAENTEYTTSAANIDGYSLTATPENASGIITGNTTVTYVYAKDVVNYTLTVKHVDANGNDLLDPKSTTMVEGAEYATAAESIDGYKLITTPANASGILNSDTTVTYVYDELEDFILTVEYMDKDSNERLDGYVSILQEGTEYATEAKIIDGYTLVETPDNASGIMDGNKLVMYFYTKDIVYYTLTVNHIDTEGNALAASSSETLAEGTLYATSEKSFEHYTLVETPEGASGEMYSDVTVTYVYAKNNYTLTVNHVDTDGNNLMAPVSETMVAGSKYSTNAAEFADYNLTETPANASGTITGNTTVTYVYAKVPYYTLTVKHVDTDGNDLLDPITSDPQKVGTPYETAAAQINDYTLTATPANAAGTLEADTVVTYVYAKVPRYVLTVKHVDEAGNDLIAPSVSDPQRVGTEYITAAAKIDHYTLKAAPANASGKLEADTTVTYVYAKNAYTLTVKYQDENGKALADAETKTLAALSEYTTEQKAIEGYTFSTTSGNAVSGIMDGNKEVIYIYTKNAETYTLVVKFVDVDGNDLADPVVTTGIVEGTAYETAAEAIEGYTLSSVSGDAATGIMDGNKEVIYVYTKNITYYTLTVKYVNDVGDDLVDPIVITDLAEGTAYATEAKAIEGYIFSYTTGDAVSGTMDADKEVIYVYNEKEPEIATYTLTVRHISGNTELASSVTEMQEGASYVTFHANFEGYVYTYTTGDPTTGVMDSDKEVIFVYVPYTPVVIEEPNDPVDIPDEPVPQSDEPEIEDDEEEVDISEEEVPLTDIPDEEPPKTGASALMAILFGTSGAGLTGMILSRKRKEEEE